MPVPEPVIVGIDGSAQSAIAVRWAAEHARTIGAPLCLIHADTSRATVTPAMSAVVGRRISTLQHPTSTDTDVLAVGAAAAAAHAPGIPVSTQLLVGGPAQVLVEASAQACLLVVGTRADFVP